MTHVVRAEIDGHESTLRVSNEGEITFEDHTVARVTRQASAAGATPDTLFVSDPRDATSAAPELRARVTLADDTVWVFIDGDVFEIEVEDAQRDRARRRDRSSEGALMAPMPATVSKVLVDVGQLVASGDTLLLLEAMKMEMPIKAPHDGRVAAIRCQPGELVQPGVPLIELTSESSLAAQRD